MCAAFVAVGIILPPDISLFLRLFIGAPILLVTSVPFFICASVSKSRRRYVPVLLTLAVFLVMSAVSVLYDFKHPLGIRSVVKWIAGADAYKNEVLAQPRSANGELQHIEWDGWGWAGQDTAVFLVFDPTDSLAAAATSGRPGKFTGIPCEVFRVRCLENHWYTVQNYTDQGWGQCN
jgi:hypothetical protein